MGRGWRGMFVVAVLAAAASAACASFLSLDVRFDADAGPDGESLRDGSGDDGEPALDGTTESGPIDAAGTDGNPSCPAPDDAGDCPSRAIAALMVDASHTFVCQAFGMFPDDAGGFNPPANSTCDGTVFSTDGDAAAIWRTSLTPTTDVTYQFEFKVVSGANFEVTGEPPQVVWDGGTLGFNGGDSQDAGVGKWHTARVSLEGASPGKLVLDDVSTLFAGGSFTMPSTLTLGAIPISNGCTAGAPCRIILRNLYVAYR